MVLIRSSVRYLAKIDMIYTSPLFPTDNWLCWAYKPLLTAIKAEYEDVIETVQRGQREAFYLSGKLKAVACGPSTLRNYRKRADELEAK